MSDNKEREYLFYVTGLRGIAALFVALSHVWYQVWPAVPPPYGYGKAPDGLMGELTEFLYFGHFGVVVFIVVSGFCLMLPIKKAKCQLTGGVLYFYRRRAIRILPPYYVAIILCLFLIFLGLGSKDGSQWDISIPVSGLSVFSHFFLLNDFVESTTINYVFWSIAVECQLYLILPLIVMAWKKLGGNVTAALWGTLVYGTIVSLEMVGVSDVPPQFVGLAFHFVAGVYAAHLITDPDFSSKLPRRRKLLFLLAGMFFITLIVGCALLGHEKAEENFAIFDLLCALGTVSVMVALYDAPRTNRLLRFFESRRLVNLGDMSYSLYLIHAPIIAILDKYIVRVTTDSDNFRFLVLLVISPPFFLVLSKIFYLLFEKPFVGKGSIKDIFYPQSNNRLSSTN
jgi:peptidoglycan/LPS O-acetylase OafA/YrhL